MAYKQQKIIPVDYTP